jgi:hypothetical protein
MAALKLDFAAISWCIEPNSPNRSMLGRIDAYPHRLEIEPFLYQVADAIASLLLSSVDLR